MKKKDRPRAMALKNLAKVVVAVLVVAVEILAGVGAALVVFPDVTVVAKAAVQ